MILVEGERFMIQVKGLTKVFKIQHRRPGFRGALQDLFTLRESKKSL